MRWRPRMKPEMAGSDKAVFSLLRSPRPLGAPRNADGSKVELPAAWAPVPKLWASIQRVSVADTYQLARGLTSRYLDPCACISPAIPVSKVQHDVPFASYGENATVVKPESTRLLVVDLDGAEITGFDPFEPQRAIRSVMDQLGFANAAAWVQLTGSQMPCKGARARLRLVAVLADAWSEMELVSLLRGWKARHPELAVDTTSGELLRRHFTSRPAFVAGVSDPLARRTWIMPGKAVVELEKPSLEQSPDSRAIEGRHATHDPSAPLSRDIHAAIVQLAHRYADVDVAEAVDQIRGIIGKVFAGRLASDRARAWKVMKGSEVEGAIRWARRQLAA